MDSSSALYVLRERRSQKLKRPSRPLEASTQRRAAALLTYGRPVSWMERAGPRGHAAGKCSW